MKGGDALFYLCTIFGCQFTLWVWFFKICIEKKLCECFQQGLCQGNKIQGVHSTTPPASYSFAVQDILECHFFTLFVSATICGMCSFCENRRVKISVVKCGFPCLAVK